MEGPKDKPECHNPDNQARADKLPRSSPCTEALGEKGERTKNHKRDARKCYSESPYLFCRYVTQALTVRLKLDDVVMEREGAGNH